MNDKLQTELTTWLQAIREHGENARGFVLEQAPDVVREMVLVGRVEITATIVLCVVVILAFGLVIRAIAPAVIKEWDECDNFAVGCGGAIVMALLAIGILVAIVAVSEQFHSFFTVWFAPRVYIIERAAALLGSMAGKG